MYKIVLVGAGNIGSRHLQGLATLDLPANITVVDPNLAALEDARQKYVEKKSPDPETLQVIDYSSSFSGIEGAIDLAIIATNSDRRYSVAERLLKQAKVRNIIFEKVVFQSVAEFSRMDLMLAKQKAKAWVNCPRRLSGFYLQLKERLGSKPMINFCLQGGEWGLGCNSIHFLDLIAFLAGRSKIERMEFSGDIMVSKRPGFIELAGLLSGRFAGGSEFLLRAARGSNMPHQIICAAKDCFAVIDESAGKAVLASELDSWQRKEQVFRLPFQSELTGKIARQILTEGNSGLPTLAESAHLHIPLLGALLKTLNQSNKRKLNRCPIT